MKEITVIGIDLAKNVFQIHGNDKHGKKVFKKRVRRPELLSTIAQIKPCLIGMEACCGAHHWARSFKQLGHDARLMNPLYVKPYIKTNKTDANDAAGIAEAVSRPSMRFVPIKSEQQLDIQMLHRVRSRLVKLRTQLSNQTRGLLGERGLVIPQGYAALRKKLHQFLDDEQKTLSPITREVIEDLYDEFIQLDQREKKYKQQMQNLAKQIVQYQYLMSIPGVGPITATILGAELEGNHGFTKGRQVSSWLGLVPKQNSSGDKIRHQGISKRGDRYIRSLLIHGARSVVNNAANKSDPYSLWVTQLAERIGVNKASVAVANKNARIAWRLINDKKIFNSEEAVLVH